MRGRCANGSQGRMTQQRQMRNRHGMMGQRGGGRGQQVSLSRGRRGNFGAGQRRADTGKLEQQDADSILLLREEEKLARDVHLTLGEQWNVPVFKNIAQSESRHMRAMKMLVDKYGLEDPVTDNTVGVFASPEFSQLYRELVASGSASLADAYEVGVKIEELDIKDLQDELARATRAELVPESAHAVLPRADLNMI